MLSYSHSFSRKPLECSVRLQSQGQATVSVRLQSQGQVTVSVRLQSQCQATVSVRLLSQCQATVTVSGYSHSVRLQSVFSCMPLERSGSVRKLRLELFKKTSVHQSSPALVCSLPPRAGGAVTAVRSQNNALKGTSGEEIWLLVNYKQ